MTEMNLDHLPEVTSTQLLWREQIAALPRALWNAARRLLRRDARYYLTVNGQVVARFVSPDDHLDFMTWLHETHTSAFEYGHAVGREYAVENHVSAPADAGDDRTP